MSNERSINGTEINRSPMLSLVTCGRNDEYVGNFKYRLSTTIDHMAACLNRLGRIGDVELLVVDWGSDVPLANVLPVSPAGGQLCKFIYVPPEVAIQESLPGWLHVSKSINVGLRRAQGQFSMIFGGDTLFPRHSITNLLELLGDALALPFDIERTFFFINRYNIPAETVEHEPSLSEWDQYLHLTAGSLVKDEELPGLGIAGAAHLMHRSLWWEFRAYDEKASGWGWTDADLSLRVTQKYPWVDLSCLGISSFHLGHWPSNSRGTLPSVPVNPFIVYRDTRMNDENWGLGNMDFEVQRAQNVTSQSNPGHAVETTVRSRPWAKTFQEFLDELTGEPVVAHAKKISELKSLPLGARESLCIVSWYSLFRHPRIFLDFGVRDPHAAVAVASASPGAAIYGIDSWQEDGAVQVLSPISLCSSLREVGHKGYTRLVTGDSRTAFRRLRDSFVGTFSLDLVRLRGELFGANAADQLLEILPYLAPGGMIVFSHHSLTEFRHAWSSARATFTDYSYARCASNQTGLILASSLADDHLQSKSDAVIDIRKATRRMKRNNLRFLGSQWRRFRNHLKRKWK
jgi:hypothetical protein